MNVFVNRRSANLCWDAESTKTCRFWICSRRGNDNHHSATFLTWRTSFFQHWAACTLQGFSNCPCCSRSFAEGTVRQLVEMREFTKSHEEVHRFDWLEEVQGRNSHDDRCERAGAVQLELCQCL